MCRKAQQTNKRAGANPRLFAVLLVEFERMKKRGRKLTPRFLSVDLGGELVRHAAKLAQLLNLAIHFVDAHCSAPFVLWGV